MFIGAQQARPVATRKAAGRAHQPQVLASTTMILSGLFLLLFVPFHSEDVQVRRALRQSPEPGSATCGSSSPKSSASPGYVVFYVAGMASSGFICGTACRARCSRWGLTRLGWSPVLRRIGWTFAVVLAVGFLSIPLYLFFLGGRS